MIQYYEMSKYLQAELTNFKAWSNQRVIIPISVLPKHNMAASTYERFSTLIQDVEHAFVTPSNRIRFSTLMTLCESIFNELLNIYNIPLHFHNEGSNQKHWYTFCEKVEKFTILMTRNPIMETENYANLKFLYTSVRHYVTHGDLEIVVTDEHVNKLLDITKHLTSNYNVDLLSYKLAIS